MATILEELQQENDRLETVILDLQDSILNPDKKGNDHKKKGFPEALYELRLANNELMDENLFLTKFKNQSTETIFKIIDDETIMREVIIRELTTEQFEEVLNIMRKELEPPKENQIGN